MNKIKVGIIGATGYVGAELVRGLAVHPLADLSALTSRSFAGKRFSDVYPAYSGICDLELTDLSPAQIAKECDLVITALPHGVSSATVPELLDAGARVIDHSGDFRYRTLEPYTFSYGLEHPCPELLSEAVYGIPELYRKELAGARLTANPGCYPTCSVLALAPLLRHGLIRTEGIIIDAVSAVSGAGRKSDLAYSFCETQESFKPYAVINHRHTTEIEQECSFLSGTDIHVTFTPHLASMKRGMFATIYAEPASSGGSRTIDVLREALKSDYAGEPFIRVKNGDELPNTAHVVGTNYIDISVRYDSITNRIKLFSALDNLGKGAALQAIQAMNVMYGFPEETGLTHLSSGL
ncbi:MAG: N-acetyl-gamma-glutamyl-phosphate reductase [Clostridiales bacterium]|nr:N-acetyl-gamma-glutamyl-phosphate reductase [Clostridiales bacterium]